MAFFFFFVFNEKNAYHSEWDGMVKELLEQRADLAIGDLTITFEREQVSLFLYFYFTLI